MLNLQNAATSDQYTYMRNFRKIFEKFLLCILMLPISLATGQGLTITGPTEAEVRQPVQLSCTGLPEKCTQLWKITPRSVSDVWLEMYDRNGNPINVYWSLEPGQKIVELIVAVNGPEVPTLSITSHQLNYGTPGPKPPVPPVPVPEPELQEVVKGLVEYKNSITESDRENLIEFYLDFSEILLGISDGMTNEQLRQSYMNAGVIFFKDTGIRGKYAGLPEIIDGILADRLGLEISEIDVQDASKLFSAIAWAFWKGGQA
jgi:hypothetical protein